MTREPERGEDEFELATTLLLHKAQQLAADRFAALIGDNNLTLRQFTLLAAINKADDPSQAHLVRVTGIDRSTLADMTNRMEKRGWIVRSASQVDQRANVVRLAPAGLKALNDARNHARAADAIILDSLQKSKRRAFFEALQKLSKVSARAELAEQREAEREAAKAERKEARRQAKLRSEAARAEGRKGRRRKRKKQREPGGAQTAAIKAPELANKKPQRADKAPKPVG